MDDARIIVPLAASAYDQAYAQLEAPGERSPSEIHAIVRDAFWTDAHLGPAALARSAHYLVDLGGECLDCSPLEVEPHSLTWEEFAPNIRAYVWPARIEGEDRTHIHVCSAQNGTEALGLADSRALEAGFLVAVALAEDEVTRGSIADLAARNLEVPASREAIAEFIGSPVALRVACRRIEETAWFTGLVVTGCE